MIKMKIVIMDVGSIGKTVMENMAKYKNVRITTTHAEIIAIPGMKTV